MIYLISNCTNAKKILPNNQFQLRNYNFMDFENTVILWNNTLANEKNEKFYAKDIYKGVGWKAAIDATINFSKKTETKLLISSAGYGLIDSMDKIVSYGVTFSKGHEDSIHNFSLNNSSTMWWDSINKFNLDDFDNNAFIFIAVPFEYLIAMQNTINTLIKKFDNRIFILNISKNKLPTSFSNNILKFDTRFNCYQPGTLTSIIQRCIKWLSNEIVINDLTLNHSVLQAYIDDFLSKQKNYVLEKRIQSTDEQIISHISNHILNENIKSATQGLKKMRLLGYACEQKRYGKLFKKTYDGIKKNG